MLQPPTLRTPWPVGPSHPCAKCGEFVPGLTIGGLCADCARQIERRASRLGRWSAMATTLLLALYLTFSLPPGRPARVVGAAAVCIWYVLTFLIVKRTAMEWMK